MKESVTSAQLGEALLSHSQRSNETHGRRKRTHGGVIDISNLQMLRERRDLFYILSFMVHNTKPVGHQVISYLSLSCPSNFKIKMLELVYDMKLMISLNV